MWDKFRSLFSEDEPASTAGIPIGVPMRGENGPMNGSNILSLQPHLNAANQEIVILHPSTFDETLLAVSCLKNRSTVVVNVSELEEDESQRFVDFISGSAYALDGKQHRIGDDIFILTPCHIGLRAHDGLINADGLIARS